MLFHFYLELGLFLRRVFVESEASTPSRAGLAGHLSIRGKGGKGVSGSRAVSDGYTLEEIVDYLRIHYTTVNKLISKAIVSKK